jgi:L-lactate utilization protein LutB
MAGRVSPAKRTVRRNITSCCWITSAPLLLADAEQRDALGCIRCGACLNVCPIFRNVGGHTYGTVYGGPIGSVITPHLRGLQDWKHLSYASSLCGACTETCPVKIDLHHHLLQNRRNASAPQTGKPIWWQKIAFKLFAPVANSPTLWSTHDEAGTLRADVSWLGQRQARWTRRRHGPRRASAADCETEFPRMDEGARTNLSERE